MAKLFKNFEDLGFLKTETEKPNKEVKKKESTKVTLFPDSYFSEILFEDNSSSFKTCFNDTQVTRILEKVSNRKIRSIVWEFQRSSGTESDRYFLLKFILHTICMKLLRLYGSKMLSFIHDLNVGVRTDNIVDQHPNLYNINLDSEELDFETLRISKGHSVKYIGFEISQFNKKPYLLVCNSSRYLQGRINELGYIEDEFIGRMKFNIFEFFSEGNISYYNAVLNTHCAVCRRELTNHDSVYYGIGPVCRGDIIRY